MRALGWSKLHMAGSTLGDAFSGRVQACVQTVLWQSLSLKWLGTHLIDDQELEHSSVLVVHPRNASKALLDEALSLAKTYSGMDCLHILAGKSRYFRPNPSTYFGAGTVQYIREQLDVHMHQQMFINAVLNGIQHRNLERALGVPVMDRMGLIINIFSQRARTREARLQVELARLEYEGSRLVRILDAHGLRRGFGFSGELEVVSGRQRSSGGGVQGALGGEGESELNLQRSRLALRKKKLKQQLEQVRKTRAVQRNGRKRGNIPMVAVVGYTNAGKSTLVSRLTKKSLECDDLLFKTLDPTLGRLVLPKGKYAIVSDTVGFISDLPVELVDAFQATLEEVLHADVLLHVLDASAPNVNDQKEVVLKILRKIGLTGRYLQKHVIEVYNKADKLTFTEPIAGLFLPVNECINESNESVNESIKMDSLEGPTEAPEQDIKEDDLDELNDPSASSRVIISSLNGQGIDQLKAVLEEKLAKLYQSRRWAPRYLDEYENMAKEGSVDDMV